jgi:signal transduction histidine kinase
MRRRDFIRAIVGSSTKAGIIFCLLALFACQVALAAEPKRVMVLHSFGRDVKPWSEYSKSIRSELERQSPWPLEIIDQSLVTTRYADENSEVAFVEYLRALFAKRPLDLIVSIGAPAASFVQRHRQQLFASTPMVFTAVERRRIDRSSLTENDVVVATVQNLPALIENILHVLPNTKTVAWVLGASPGEKRWLEDVRKDLAPFADRLSFIWYSDLSFADILKHAAALPPHSAIFWHLMNVDAAGVVHDGDTGLASLYAVANAPIFTWDQSFFGREIVGGPMQSVDEISKKTAEVAVRILGGEKPGDIKPSFIRPASPIFDWRQMQRWGISEKNLPPGSKILFRPPTAWEQYKPHILAITAAILAQALLIAWLIHERQSRRRAERTARETFSELAQVNRMATAGELSATIAHEVKQPLTAMATLASAALRWLSRENPDIGRARDALDKVVVASHHASDVITNVRAMFEKDTQEKTPTDVNELIRSVLALVYIDLRKHGVETQMSLDEQLPPVIVNQVQLRQVILNLVMNAIEAMNAAEPRLLSIKSENTGHNSIRVSIEDTGSGIDRSHADRVFKPLFTTKARGMGMGLAICRSIIESHGGKIWVSAGASRGSIFQFELPVYQSDEGKSDWSDRTSATLSGSPASPPSLADEVIE